MRQVSSRLGSGPSATLLLCLLAGAAPAAAGDLCVFVSTASPTESWGKGYGAVLSSNWFKVFNLEAEAERLGGDETGGWGDLTMTSFTASALLAPPVGKLTPYGGLGVGLFRQASARSEPDIGRLRAFILGCKLGLGLVVFRVDYRRIDLSGEPLLGIETRLAAAAGISF